MKSRINTMNLDIAPPIAPTIPHPDKASADSDGRHAMPNVSQKLLRWFTWYSRRYINRHFHSLRVSRADLPLISPNLPVVVFTNHASWWDPLVGLVLKNEFFPDRTLFAPIDAAALNRYKLLAKLGFFGIEKNSGRGAAQFLRSAETILRARNSLLAITPQSRFGDVRERPVQFQPGLGHLAARADHAIFLPVAMEYVFWEERLPEILVRFGPTIEVKSTDATSPRDWTLRLEEKLSNAQDALASEVKNRNPDNFQDVLRGGAGHGGVYDWWRNLRSKVRGERFQKEHGTK